MDPIFSLSTVSREQLQKVFKKHALRGHNIDTLARKGNLSNLFIENNQISSVNGKKERRYTVDLNSFANDDPTSSFSRFCYWIKKTFFCCCFDKEAHKEKYIRLADAVYDTLHPKPQPPMPADDFLLMKNVLKSTGNEIIFDNFQINYDATDSAFRITNTKDLSTLAFFIGPQGDFKKLEIDGHEQSDHAIPKERSHWLPICFKTLANMTSNYAISSNDKFIEVQTLKRGVETDPVTHLAEISRCIKTALSKKGHPRINVKLMGSDLEASAGADNGGLSRDYFSSMMNALINLSNYFKCQSSSNLFLPHAGAAKVFRDLGTVMMFCYRSKPNISELRDSHIGGGHTLSELVEINNNAYTLGQYFDEALFEVALTLTVAEINTPFDKLSYDVIVKMAKKAMEVYLKKDIAEYKAWRELVDAGFEIDNSKTKNPEEYIQMFDIFNWKKGESLERFKNSNAAAAMGSVEEEDFPAELKECLFDYFDGGPAIRDILEPIHAIAQGFNDVLVASKGSWVGSVVDPSEFADKIQGSLDRNEIANSFELLETYWIYMDDKKTQENQLTFVEKNELNKKIGWLQNWIQADTTTDDELRKFLTYTTGANALPPNQKLFVEGSATPTPIPSANTCVYKIALSITPCPPLIVGGRNDLTEEAFLEVLHKYILSAKTFTFDKD